MLGAGLHPGQAWRAAAKWAKKRNQSLQLTGQREAVPILLPKGCPERFTAGTKVCKSGYRRYLEPDSRPRYITKNMGRRHQPRIKGILPVRIWGTDQEGRPFAEHLCTIDISNKGVSLAAVRTRLLPNDIVGLQYRTRQARFRVVWVVPTSSGLATHVGLESLQPEKELWPVATPTEGADPYTPSNEQIRKQYCSHSSRRAQTRFPVVGTAYVKENGGADGHWAKLSDISMNGCYLETHQPLQVGRRTALSIKIAHNEFQASGIVRACYARTAMGLEFTFLNKTDRRVLHRLIAHLREFDAVAR